MPNKIILVLGVNGMKTTILTDLRIGSGLVRKYYLFETLAENCFFSSKEISARKEAILSEGFQIIIYQLFIYILLLRYISTTLKISTFL